MHRALHTSMTMPSLLFPERGMHYPLQRTIAPLFYRGSNDLVIT